MPRNTTRWWQRWGGGRPLAAGLVAVLVGAVLSVTGPASAAAASTAGNATGLTQSGSTYTVSTSSGAKARVAIARADIFRIWLSPT
ncbi:hypothetical protein ACFVXQ_16445, partial [Kitasatospora sp. NPDC058263]